MREYEWAVEEEDCASVGEVARQRRLSEAQHLYERGVVYERWRMAGRADRLPDDGVGQVSRRRTAVPWSAGAKRPTA